ncbi:hypothetical protein DIPPA_27432 [Diplonema papillatum]|nr:hypothetical protein DIPPA_27432 [Diplonema papillatum]
MNAKSSTEELKQDVKNALLKEGTLGKMRAQMRECVLRVLQKSSFESFGPVYGWTERSKEVCEKSECRRACEIVAEFLATHDLDYTASVMKEEASAGCRASDTGSAPDFKGAEENLPKYAQKRLHGKNPNPGTSILVQIVEDWLSIVRGWEEADSVSGKPEESRTSAPLGNAANVIARDTAAPPQQVGGQSAEKDVPAAPVLETSYEEDNYDDDDGFSSEVSPVLRPEEAVPADTMPQTRASINSARPEPVLPAASPPSPPSHQSDSATYSDVEEPPRFNPNTLVHSTAAAAAPPPAGSPPRPVEEPQTPPSDVLIDEIVVTPPHDADEAPDAAASAGDSAQGGKLVEDPPPAPEEPANSAIIPAVEEDVADGDAVQQDSASSFASYRSDDDDDDVDLTKRDGDDIESEPSEYETDEDGF